MELILGKNQNAQKPIHLVVIILVLLAIVPLYFHYPLFIHHQSTYSPQLRQPYHAEVSSEYEKCDIFSGEWVPNPEAPYYTNSSCWAIHEHQNCMKYGRPDTGFMKWRWKPDGCDLPIFNPFEFLDIVRGKSLAIIGDSVGRNQIQSLICMLSRVEYPIDESYTKDQSFKRWRYPSYNFTLEMFWSPFLVNVREQGANGSPTHTSLFHIYFDQIDEIWSTQIDDFDYIIINAGHWFHRESMYYENGNLKGCHLCQLDNTTELPQTYGYRRALRTVFKAINSLENFKGITFLRTYAPSHFEGGKWNEGGNCARKKPFRSNETTLDGVELDFYLTQTEEFRIAEREGLKKGLKYRLFDITQAMLLRPDGHPSRYGHWPNENVTVYNDCLHWCLPGPIDSWSDFLLHMLKKETRGSYQ